MTFRLTSLATAGALGAMAVLGTSWWQSQAAKGIPIADVSHLHGIAVDASDPSRLYLATHYGVFRTTPDGMAEQVSDNANDYMGFTAHPTEPGTFFASGHPSTGGNMGVIVSQNGAQNWEELASGVDGPVDFHAMDVSAADPNVLYGLYGDVQVSRDAGKTWEVAGSPPADVFDISASAIDPETLYAATRSGLMVSRDGGKSWTATGPEGQPASMVQASAADGSVYAFVVGSGLMKTPGSALNWQPVANEFGDAVLLHLAADPSDANRLFAVTNEGKILASTDGGQSWSAWPA
jgi:photosystem II stability/assembly factor-like uncharacterized protein